MVQLIWPILILLGQIAEHCLVLCLLQTVDGMVSETRMKEHEVLYLVILLNIMVKSISSHNIKSANKLGPVATQLGRKFVALVHVDWDDVITNDIERLHAVIKNFLLERPPGLWRASTALFCFIIVYFTAHIAEISNRRHLVLLPKPLLATLAHARVNISEFWFWSYRGLFCKCIDTWD